MLYRHKSLKIYDLCVFTRMERQRKIYHACMTTQAFKNKNVKIFPKIFLTINEACRNLWSLTRINKDSCHFVGIFNSKLPKLIHHLEKLKTCKNYYRYILSFVCSEIGWILLPNSRPCNYYTHTYIHTSLYAYTYTYIQ